MPLDYLLFSDPDHISLDDFTFNTEAHPLRIPKKSNAFHQNGPELKLWRGPKPKLEAKVHRFPFLYSSLSHYFLQYAPPYFKNLSQNADDPSGMLIHRGSGTVFQQVRNVIQNTHSV
jgi:hypothetical protein